MSILIRLLREAKGVYSTYFEGNDQLLSKEIKEILEDSDQREAYFKAIDQLKDSKKKEENVEINLKGGRKIKISLTH
jgi:inosine/xanthosine triphosphate pyrophosphatase family protein